jgi:hypothetical protein
MMKRLELIQGTSEILIPSPFRPDHRTATPSLGAIRWLAVPN